MAKYRKKPVEIEAFQYDGDFMNKDGYYYVPDWAVCANAEGVLYFEDGELFIKTLEGIHHASVGDYIIRGVKGELYPCKPDIFEMTYETGEIGEISDGYHTFNELYYHRMILFSVICNSNSQKSWKSWKHHDGTMYDDYFIVGIDTQEGQYSYHYHKSEWDYFNVEELEFAPEWDGRKPKDITRLLSLI